MNIVAKVIPYLRFKSEKVFKRIMLKIFYGKNYHISVESFYVGQILAIIFFQKILRVNSHIPFPVHFTNQINKIGDLKMGGAVSAEFAAAAGLYVQKINGIEIESGTIIASGCKLISANHSLNDFGKYDEAPPIRIGKNCWLGANSVILPGVCIGNNCIIGAGAVVTKNFEDNCIIGGVPARLIKKIPPNIQ